MAVTLFQSRKIPTSAKTQSLWYRGGLTDYWSMRNLISYAGGPTLIHEETTEAVVVGRAAFFNPT